MARKQKSDVSKAGRKRARKRAASDGPTGKTPQPFLAAQLQGTPQAPRSKARRARINVEDLSRRLRELNMRPTIDLQKLSVALGRINPSAPVPVKTLPEEVRESMELLRPNRRSFHGTKLSLAYFPWPLVFSPCADKFGYMSSAAIRTAT